MAACHLERNDFPWELLRYVPFTLSCWIHLCLSPVANKITVLSSTEENNSENTTLNGALPLPLPSCLPGDHQSSSCISRAFLFSPCSTLKGFLIPQFQIHTSNLKVQLLVLAYFISLRSSNAGQNFFASRMDFMQGSECQDWSYSIRLSFPFSPEPLEFVEQCIFTLSTKNPREPSK